MRNARRETADPIEASCRGIRYPRGEVGREPERFFFLKEPEAARHHTDHGIADVVEQHLLAEGVGLTAEAPVPHRIADDHHALGAWRSISVRERAAQLRLHAEH